MPCTCRTSSKYISLCERWRHRNFAQNVLLWTSTSCSSHRVIWSHFVPSGADSIIQNEVHFVKYQVPTQYSDFLRSDLDLLPHQHHRFPEKLQLFQVYFESKVFQEDVQVSKCKNWRFLENPPPVHLEKELESYSEIHKALNSDPPFSQSDMSSGVLHKSGMGSSAAKRLHLAITVLVFLLYWTTRLHEKSNGQYFGRQTVRNEKTSKKNWTGDNGYQAEMKTTLATISESHLC